MINLIGLAPMTAIEGFGSFIQCLAYAFLIAIISVVVSLWLKLTYKDRIVIFITNIMTKTLIFMMLSLFQSQMRLIVYIDYLVLGLSAVVSIVLDGVIYKRLIEYKKINSMLLSLMLNLIAFTVAIIVKIAI